MLAPSSWPMSASSTGITWWSYSRTSMSRASSQPLMNPAAGRSPSAVDVSYRIRRSANGRGCTGGRIEGRSAALGPFGHAQEGLPALAVTLGYAVLLRALLAALELVLGALQALAQVTRVEVAEVVGLLDEQQDAVRRHLQVALGLGVALDLALGAVQPQLGGLEDGQQRLVVGQHADRSRRRAGGDHLHLVVEQLALGGEDLRPERRAGHRLAGPHGAAAVAALAGALLVAVAARGVAFAGLAVGALAGLLGRLAHGRARAAGGLDDLLDAALEQELALGDVVVLAVEDLAEPADRLGDRDVLARGAGEGLGHEERLRQEALDAPGPVDGELVVVGELVDAEDGDDVLQLLVALQHLLDLVGHGEVVLPDDLRLEDGRGRVERIDGRVDPLLEDRPREHGRRVEVGEHGGRRRVGEVIGRHVDRLDRGHRALPGGGDALLQLTHLGLQGRLVADLGGHAPQQRGDLRAGLHEAEDVVDEQQHVLAALLAEVLGHGQAREGHAHTGAGRLVHLAEDQDGLLEHAGLLHLQPQVVALARALAHAAERRQALVLLGDVADQLLDEHGLAHARAAEQADLPALGVRGEQVDDLDAGLEHLGRRGQILDVGGGAVDRPALLELDVAHVVDRIAEQVEEAPEDALADRDGDRAAGVDDLHAAGEAVGGVHGHRADAVVAEDLLDLAHEQGLLVVVAVLGPDRVAFLAGQLDGDGVVDLRQVVGEDRLDDDALDLLDPADVAVGPGSVASGLLLVGADCH